MNADQKRAIANLMAQRRRAWQDDGRRAYQFPKWVPGMSTGDYIARCRLPNKLRVGDALRLNRPAPYYHGPEVVEDCDDDPCPYHAWDCAQ